MFDRGDAHIIAGAEGGAEGGIHHVFPIGGNRRRAGEVGAPELDAGPGGRRLQGQGYFLAGMERDTHAVGRARQGPLRRSRRARATRLISGAPIGTSFDFVKKWEF